MSLRGVIILFDGNVNTKHQTPQTPFKKGVWCSAARSAGVLFYYTSAVEIDLVSYTHNNKDLNLSHVLV